VTSLTLRKAECDKARYAANREVILGYQKAYRDANREKQKAKAVKYRAANPEKVKGSVAKYKAANPSINLLSNICVKYKVPVAELRQLIPQELIEVKLLQIQLRRLIYGS